MISTKFDQLATARMWIQHEYGERPRNKEGIFRSIVQTFCYACSEYNGHMIEDEGMNSEEVMNHQKYNCERCIFGPWGEYEKMNDELMNDMKEYPNGQ